MADPLSRRALLSGSFLKELTSPSAKEPSLVVEPSAARSKAPVHLATEPPLAEVHVYGTARPAPSLSVEASDGESPPPWSRRE